MIRREVKIYVTAPHHVWDHVEKLKTPLLVVRGKESDVFLPGAVRELRKRRPDAAYHDVKGAAHLAPVERPTEVGEAMHKFSAQLDR